MDHQLCLVQVLLGECSVPQCMKAWSLKSCGSHPELACNLCESVQMAEPSWAAVPSVVK